MQVKKTLKTLVLLVVVIAIHLVSPRIGDYYHINIYPTIDKLLVWISKFAQFPIGDVLYFIAALLIIRKSYLYIKAKKWLNVVLYLSNITLVFFITFQLFWGLNNYKSPLHHTLNISQTYSIEQLENFTHKKINNINILHAKIAGYNEKVIIEKDYELFYTEAIKQFKNTWFLDNYSLENLNPSKPSVYSYFLSRAGFSGYFNPYTHENQINYEVPTIGMPLTYTHEMTHQLGFASEAEANFIAYYTLKNSTNLKLRYAAELYGLKYALKEVRKIDEEKFLCYFENLNPGIIENIKETEEFWSKHKNFSSKIFKPLYGIFLKANNQKHGIRSYNRMVNLMINYDEKYTN